MPRRIIDPPNPPRVHYAKFTKYVSMCRCGECFHLVTWVEESPEERADAEAISRLLYQKGSPNGG